MPNDFKLTGVFKDVLVEDFFEGVLPTGYGSAIVNPSAVDPSSPLTYDIGGLPTGSTWYVFVLSHNDRGYGSAVASTPEFASPMEAPGPVSGVVLSTVDDQTLRVEYEEAGYDGGKGVVSYRVDLDKSSTFASEDLKSVDMSIDHLVQRVTTSAHTTGIDGSFKLSFGTFEQLGGFHTRLCDHDDTNSEVFVSVADGGTELVRVSGTRALDECVTVGEYHRIIGHT
jgi:hypothetical protein